jgi:hypothetical protein
MKPNNLLGTRYERLTVIADGGRCPKQNILWLCQCDCGNTTLAFAYDLRGGKVKSCGCYAADAARGRAKHGMARAGAARSSEYNVWSTLVQRCTNRNDRNWGNYGGRGITVTKRWRVFENFLEDMGCRPSPKHSIDRINNDKGYSKRNCRWATREEQSRNRRGNVFITVRGKTLCLTDWASNLGVSRQALFYWKKKGVDYGYTIKRILSKE